MLSSLLLHAHPPTPQGHLVACHGPDEIVNKLVTRAQPHNQCLINPLQDRVLSVRENARFQGFPDFYKLCLSTKENYMIQVGNAVAVLVEIALSYALGMASQGLCDDEPVIKIPFNYPQYLMMHGNSKDYSDRLLPKEEENKSNVIWQELSTICSPFKKKKIRK